MSWDGILRADARHLPIADESVQCVVTSPPYWGLRRYDVPSEVQDLVIGNESSIEEYIDNIRAVFREVWRVLKLDGLIWVNMGDCYCAAPNAGTGWDSSTLTKPYGRPRKIQIAQEASMLNDRRFSDGVKRKDLIGQPWLVAFALRSDGWYLRQEIIWHKTQAMPEPVKDRPTRAHEQLFLLSKNQHYFYDADAIKEPAKSAERASGIKANEDFHANCSKEIVDRVNKRSVWSLGTAVYPEAHYATFPPNLVEPCILAGSKPGDIVLDPFFGSGTVGMVAEKWNRRWIGCDLGYQDLQKKRVRDVRKMLNH